MPRQSAEARATSTASRAGKLRPSPHLSTTERRVWRVLVAATPAGHLSERDRPLLESFVSLAVAQRKLSELVAVADAAEQLLSGTAGNALKRMEATGRTLAALSSRLKLGPLASHSAAHKAGQRSEQPAPPARLLGGLRAIK